MSRDACSFSCKTHQRKSFMVFHIFPVYNIFIVVFVENLKVSYLSTCLFFQISPFKIYQTSKDFNCFCHFIFGHVGRCHVVWNSSRGENWPRVYFWISYIDSCRSFYWVYGMYVCLFQFVYYWFTKNFYT